MVTEILIDLLFATVVLLLGEQSLISFFKDDVPNTKTEYLGGYKYRIYFEIAFTVLLFAITFYQLFYSLRLPTALFVPIVYSVEPVLFLVSRFKLNGNK